MSTDAPKGHIDVQPFGDLFRIEVRDDNKIHDLFLTREQLVAHERKVKAALYTSKQMKKEGKR